MWSNSGLSQHKNSPFRKSRLLKNIHLLNGMTSSCLWVSAERRRGLEQMKREKRKQRQKQCRDTSLSLTLFFQEQNESVWGRKMWTSRYDSEGAARCDARFFLKKWTFNDSLEGRITGVSRQRGGRSDSQVWRLALAATWCVFPGHPRGLSGLNVLLRSPNDSFGNLSGSRQKNKHGH